MKKNVIEVKYLDQNFKEHHERIDGLFSRVFQHEFDHINSVDFTQKVSKLKRDMAIKKWKKKYGRTKLSLPI